MIYADYGATTPLDKEVLNEMLPYFSTDFGNPSSVHAFGREAARAVEKARGDIADIINADKNEIYFTSGGTESDNWALSGIETKHIVTSSIEHHAVLHTCERLKQAGTDITYVSPQPNGIVNTCDIAAALTKETKLVSLMTANNEIGTLQPIDEVGELLRSKNILFHTDAVQAAGYVDFDVKKQKTDMLSMSAHKFYGPKGIGFLYVRSGIKLKNLMEGGAQERDRRPGTVNVAGAVGMAAALRRAYGYKSENYAHTAKCAEIIKNKVMRLEGAVLNGDEIRRLPGTLNFSFGGIKSEGILFLLDMYGVCCSSGSACSAGAVGMSHVISAIRPGENNSLRVCVSKLTSFEEAEEIGDKIVLAVNSLRKV